MIYRVSIFSRLAGWTAHATGHPIGFSIAVLVVLIWAITGPLFGFSDTWQLVINTGTTIVTFLMIFLVQNTQNRESAAMQLKLDELIRAVKGAHNTLLALENASDDEIRELRQHYEMLAKRARHALQNGEKDTGCPDVQLR